MNEPFLIDSLNLHSPISTTKRESMVCPPWQLPYHSLTTCSDMLLKISSVKSDHPTRHIALYSKHALLIGHHDLFKSLTSTSGDIRAIYPYVSAGITIISYYSLQDAQKGLQVIQKKYTFEACFAKPCLINKKANERVFVTISCNNPLVDLKHFDYMKYLTHVGSIYSISKANVTDSCVIINLEYHDERSSTNLLARLNFVTIKGIQFNVYRADNDECDCLMSAVNSPLVTPLPTPSPTPMATPEQTPLPTPTTSKTLSEKPITEENDKRQAPEADDDKYSSTPSDEKPKMKKQTSASSMNNSEAAASSPSSEGPCSSKDNDFDMDKIAQGLDKRTTFMIRNIPNKYTQKMLIDCINATHANSYDFLYLRIDFQNKCNVGYAFINFIDPKSAISFAKEKVGKKWKLFNSDKRCTLSYANIQGKDALIRKFKNSHVMSEEAAYRPKLFYSSGPNQGKEQPFPKSAKEEKWNSRTLRPRRR